VVQVTGTNRWMRGSSAPLRGALLGLLLQHPGHGGDLVGRLKRRLGETWRIDVTDVYRLLKRLEEEGVARSEVDERAGNERRTRLIYYPTEQTAEAVRCWMETLMPREPVRLGLQAKLAVAREEDVPRIVRALREYERECMALAQFVLPSDVRPQSWEGLFLDGTRDAVYGSLRADIDWSVRMRQRIAEYAARPQ
jgi:DNA-binding PadR family transcriptional regulator